LADFTIAWSALFGEDNQSCRLRSPHPLPESGRKSNTPSRWQTDHLVVLPAAAGNATE